MRIELTQRDVVAAVSVATFHTMRCILKKAEPKDNQPRDERLDATLTGYLAEVAVARCVGIEWPQPHTISWEGREEGDIILSDGRILEVRGTEQPNHTHLLGHRDDHDDRFYVLVIPVDEDTFTYDVEGYMIGHEMKNEHYWNERVPGRPCFWVPRTALTPFARG
ncbi:MAG: hypothetical protein KAJ42_17390 [Gemmatimonadetes bacterium]|nr:hypothetical protein [Gemmatimonadota bacterium]